MFLTDRRTVLVGLSSTLAAAALAQNVPVVETASGKLQGFVQDSAVAFFGIPTPPPPSGRYATVRRNRPRPGPVYAMRASRAQPRSRPWRARPPGSTTAPTRNRKTAFSSTSGRPRLEASGQ